MHFDLTDLRLFAAVVERGSITGGAAQAGLALPSASARIRGMETALGSPLLSRGRRGVEPTPAGLVLDHHARLVLERMEHLRGELRLHARGGLRGHIRLLSNTAALDEHLPDRLGGWLADHPGVDIDLEEKPSHQVAPAIAAGYADIGVLADPSGAQDVQTFPFAVDRLVVVLPRDHALGRKRQISFPDLLDEDVVGLAHGSALAAYLAWQATRLGRVLRVRIRLRDLDAMCQLVEHGVGVAVVPEAAAQRCRQRMAIRMRSLAEPWSVRRLSVCVRRLDALSPHARALAEHLIGARQDADVPG